jgi:D-alanyl-lipoteichoic acid acyltransferase DltB (MBOAT superfamily)
LSFLIFFPIVVLIYFAVPKRMKRFWLLAASYYFYMCWNAKYVLLIFFSTVVTYLSGIFIEQVKGTSWDERQKAKYKKWIVAGSFILNLSILFYFKYANFAFDTLQSVLALVHIKLNVPTVDVLLPVGISFYTFQALGYTVDVYRDEIYAERDFIQYALFVSFFPQLVAGPIERSKNLLKQLAVPQRFQFERACDGVWLMLWGYFLKIVLADRIAIFVDTVYGDYTTYAGWYLIIATMLFAVQIYCDFYGYSVIAMGAAEILGIQLMENFDAPYLSASVAEFWRRWHISLTSWFKDYLYIPLGGSRKGRLRKYLNKLAVFLVSGLWHGAQFSYVVWGGLNGIYQIVGEALTPLRDQAVKLLGLNRQSLGHRLLRMAVTFVLVDFSWIFFRASCLNDALQIIGRMAEVHNPWILMDGSIYECGLDSKNFWLVLICIGILLFADYCRYKKIQIRKVIETQDFWFKCIFFVMVVCAILTFGIWGPGYNEASFIYFQF